MKKMVNLWLAAVAVLALLGACGDVEPREGSPVDAEQATDTASREDAFKGDLARDGAGPVDQSLEADAALPEDMGSEDNDVAINMDSGGRPPVDPGSTQGDAETPSPDMGSPAPRPDAFVVQNCVSVSLPDAWRINGTSGPPVMDEGRTRGWPIGTWDTAGHRLEWCPGATVAGFNPVTGAPGHERWSLQAAEQCDGTTDMDGDGQPELQGNWCCGRVVKDETMYQGQTPTQLGCHVRCGPNQGNGLLNYCD